MWESNVFVKSSTSHRLSIGFSSGENDSSRSLNHSHSLSLVNRSIVLQEYRQGYVFQHGRLWNKKLHTASVRVKRPGQTYKTPETINYFHFKSKQQLYLQFWETCSVVASVKNCPRFIITASLNVLQQRAHRGASVWFSWKKWMILHRTGFSIIDSSHLSSFSWT